MNAFFQKIRQQDLPLVAAVLTVLNALLFHGPFFSYLTDHVQSSANGVLIWVSWLLILLAVNYLGFVLTLFLGRTVGKILIGISMVINAGCLYFIHTYDVMLDDTMMGNVFNTQYSEASSFASWSMLAYLLTLGLLPALLLSGKSRSLIAALQAPAGTGVDDGSASNNTPSSRLLLTMPSVFIAIICRTPSRLRMIV